MVFAGCQPLLLCRMKAKSLFVLLYWILGSAAVAGLLGSYGCASIGSPMGGAKDTISPVLVKASPLNFTPNFKNRTIELIFDEYVELNSVFEKVVINPAMEKFPLIDRKLRTVTIKLKDTLEANTTYSLRFDDAIRDVNEGNPLGNFTYVFSTGDKFDSASFSGRVLDAETGKVDSTLIVVLHNNLADSAIEKLKPRYITKMDGKGFFRFEYIAPGRYNVYALKDEGVKRYNDSSLPFAFHDNVIDISDSTAPVEMLFFKAKNRAQGNPDDGEVTPAPAKKTMTEEEMEEAKKLNYRADLGAAGSLDIFSDLHLKFDKPIKTLDSTKILFSDTLSKPIAGYRLQLDSTAKDLSLQYKWKLDTWYQLVFLKGFAADSAGITTTKNDTLRFKTKGEADYGSIKIEFAGLDFAQNPVLVFLQNSNIVQSVPLKGTVYSDKLFKPAEYEIRILLDRNGNGVWDTGDYWKKLQPERVLAFEKKITVKANWENEFLIDINAPEEPEKK
jgi:Bacterial Ig-like domain